MRHELKVYKAELTVMVRIFRTAW